MNRKLLSLLLALTFVFSMSVSAGASSFDNPATSSSAFGLEVVGTGSAVYVDTEIYHIGFPTSKTLEFTLDPQGLVGATSGQSFSALDGGKVIGADPEPLVNNGYYPVIITASAMVSATGTLVLNQSPTVTSTGALDPNTASGTSMSLYVIPSTANTITTSAFNAATGGFLLSSNVATEAVNMQFALPAADYTLLTSSEGSTSSDDYKLELKADTGHGFALQIGGFMNPKGDWSAYAKGTSHIYVKVIFDYTKDTATAARIDSDFFSGAGLTSASYLLANASLTTKVIAAEGGAGASRAAVTIAGTTTTTVTTGLSKATVWTSTVPLTILIENKPSTVAVATSSANLASSAWTSGTDYTYNATTGLLTITRVPSGTVIAVRCGGSTAAVYTLNFNS